MGYVNLCNSKQLTTNNLCCLRPGDWVYALPINYRHILHTFSVYLGQVLRTPIEEALELNLYIRFSAVKHSHDNICCIFDYHDSDSYRHEFGTRGPNFSFSFKCFNFFRATESEVIYYTLGIS